MHHKFWCVDKPLQNKNCNQWVINRVIRNAKLTNPTEIFDHIPHRIVDRMWNSQKNIYDMWWRITTQKSLERCPTVFNSSATQIYMLKKRPLHVNLSHVYVWVYWCEGIATSTCWGPGSAALLFSHSRKMDNFSFLTAQISGISWSSLATCKEQHDLNLWIRCTITSQDLFDVIDAELASTTDLF